VPTGLLLAVIVLRLAVVAPQTLDLVVALNTGAVVPAAQHATMLLSIALE
jgi:hypothetical protein